MSIGEAPVKTREAPRETREAPREAPRETREAPKRSQKEPKPEPFCHNTSKSPLFRTFWKCYDKMAPAINDKMAPVLASFGSFLLDCGCHKIQFGCHTAIELGCHSDRIRVPQFV